MIREDVKQIEAKWKKEKKENDKLNDSKEKVQAIVERLKKPQEAIDSTLSCLSCLTYLSEPKPLTLQCGHSICNNVRDYLYQPLIVLQQTQRPQ